MYLLVKVVGYINTCQDCQGLPGCLKFKSNNSIGCRQDSTAEPPETLNGETASTNLSEYSSHESEKDANRGIIGVPPAAMPSANTEAQLEAS